MKKEVINYNLGGLIRENFDKNDHLFEDKFYITDCQLPKQFDLLDKTPESTKQVGVGNCVAHAAAMCLRFLEGNKDIDFSRAFLYYQARKLNGDTERDNGTTIRNVMKILKRDGDCENKYMSNELLYKIPPSKEAFENAKKYKIKEYLRINSLTGIKTWLVGRQQSIIFGLQVNDDFKSEKVAKTGRVKIPNKNENCYLAHASLIIGYRDSTRYDKFCSHFNKRYSPTGYLLCKNSWGSDWGYLDSYFWLPYEFIAKGCAFDFWICER